MSWFGIVKNIFGKTEKNAKVKEGECIFPFKYKWQEHNECIDTEKGPICATEINPDTKTLTKYGYCQKRSIKKLSSAEKKTPRKSSISSHKPKKTIKKRKLKKKFLIADDETKSQYKMEESQTKPKFKALSPIQGEKLEEKKKIKTLKKKIPKTFKIIEESIDLKPSHEVIQEEPMKSAEQIPVPKIKTYNEEFIEVLGELADLMQGQGEIFRAKAYQKAQEAIMLYEGDITDPNQLKGMKGIGETILSKLNEYVETGTIKALEKQRKNPINVLTKVYGIGPKKAQELIKKDITTIEKLRENQDELNDIQKVGLKYYEDINERIPRAEIDEYKAEFVKSFEEVAPEESKFEIVGSYRRQKQMSGDIDVIITNNKGDESVFKKFVDDLINKGIIVEVLSRGKSKCLVITRLEGKKARRVDFLYTPPIEYAFAILYFTGSKAFNTVMRQRALDRGYTLNEHGFSVMTKAIKGEKGVKGDKVSQEFPSEKSIFDFLDMQYKYPNERIDGRAVQNKITDVEVIELGSVKTPIIQQEKVDDVEKVEDVKEKEIIKKAKKGMKNVTLKKRKINPVELIEKFKQDGISSLKSLTEAELEAMLIEANESYYIKGESLMTDNQYDILREHMLERYPDNVVAIDGHAAIELKVSKNKVKLPYEMWSMDKIKPDTDVLKKWVEKFPDPYILSCKLDGVSGLYVTEGSGKPKLYTRGNGIIGQDVTHLIPYLKMPKGKGFAVRGEFIISKSKFEEKYSKEFANPRNFVAGLINKKTIESDKLRDLDFVTYEVIKPDMKPSQQLKYLEDREAEVVRYTKLKKISNEILSELLVTWRADYKYEIDGIICTHDDIHPRVSGNPDYAFAFKMVLSEQVAEAKVVDVLWTPTKDGFLKPRVQIEPISLGGVTITYATGFNAKFIEENKIGVGAVVQLVRSGDVIPHILSVPVPADKPLMPAIPYEWNESHVDIMLVDGKENEIVREKNIEFFFNKIEVEGFKIGKIKKVIEAGYDTIPKILRMTPEDFQKIEGFAKKSANQIQASIAQKIGAANLVKLMMATNFARGIGDKKISAIIEAIPDILTSNKTVEQKIAQIKTVKGNSDITARKFVEGIPEFLEFISEAGLQKKLAYIVEEKKGDETHPLYGKKIVMTGFRDKELGEMIENVGGELSAAVSKNTFIVLVKDIDESTGKAGKARELGIELMTPDDFKKKYF